jgi:hypothetical protein
LLPPVVDDGDALAVAAPPAAVPVVVPELVELGAAGEASPAPGVLDAVLARNSL